MRVALPALDIDDWVLTGQGERETHGAPVLRPARTSMRVVFPAPDTPTRAVRMPGWKAPLTSFSSCSMSLPPSLFWSAISCTAQQLPERVLNTRAEQEAAAKCLRCTCKQERHDRSRRLQGVSS